MIIISQRNPKWSQIKLGLSNLTIGRFGCTTCALSMLTDYFGKYITPDRIAGCKTYYTKDGLILWQNLKLPMKFKIRRYGNNIKEIDSSLKNPNKAVILEVDKSHWVVAIRKTLLGNDYVVVDPWFGDKCNVKKRYRNITGSAHFIKI